MAYISTFSHTFIILLEFLWLSNEIFRICSFKIIVLNLDLENQHLCAVLIFAYSAINPHTGQLDYSAAWADYYRQQGLHQHAQAILQGGSSQIPQ